MKIPATDVKNSFGKYLRLCIAEPVLITKNGQVIAKLESYHEDKTEMVNEVEESCNANRPKMTFEAFEQMNRDADKRYEYIDGEVYLMTAPSVTHQWIVSKLHVALDRYLERKSCDVFESPFDVTLKKRGKWNVVQPDLLVICDWQKDVDEKDRYRGVPKLVVEVMSPSSQSKDMITKLNLYMHAGIEEYWVISPMSKSGLVYKFENNEIVKIGNFTEGDTWKSFIYEGFEWQIK